MPRGIPADTGNNIKPRKDKVMKKILALLLSLLMLITAMPIFASAAETDAKIYGPTAIVNSYDVGFAGITTQVVTEKNETYVKGDIAPGSYANNTLAVSVSPVDFSITEYKFVKVKYKTNSTSPIIDISARSSVGESWMNAHPGAVRNGSWHEMILNIADIVGGAGAIPEGEIGATFTMKPYNSLTVTLGEGHYFDLQYIAFFKTREAADAYKYKASDDINIEDLPSQEIFWEEADTELINGYFKTMDEMIENIKNSTSNLEVTGTKYYVSNSGDDNNDGLSPETAWKTIDKVNMTVNKQGDGVFFKRGDTWRTEKSLYAKSGITYSAYGEGEKPLILASADGSGTGSWIETEHKNVYAFKESIPGIRDVGTIVFDGGRAWGIQIQQTTQGNRLAIGTVFNGLERFTSDTGRFAGPEHLKNDLEFYHNWENKTLYLYSKDGNPADRFSTIEIVDKGHGIVVSNANDPANPAHDIMIDNIAIYGTGSHGIGGGSMKNVTVQYCVLEWIGGSIQSKTMNNLYGVRYGNAVECYGDYCDNFIIRDCYASQVYDCCWTIQYGDKANFNNVKMYNNISEYCNTGLEIWQSNGSITNMDLYNNYTRFNGYGWSHQRPTKDGNFFYGGSGLGEYENNNVRNNVNIFASANALLVKATGPKQYNFHDNVYIMENDKHIGGLAKNPGLGTGGWGSTNTKYDKESIARACSTGFEANAKFYYTEPSAYTKDMYDTYNPESGVERFEDISDNFWGRNAIDYVSISGYFNGVTPTTFSPNGTMTRAMLAVVLSRIAGESADGNSATYTDINKNSWYAPGVAWAEKAGIVAKGGKFRPDENATREELADMLYKFAKYNNRKIDLNGATEFKDAGKVNAAYADSIKFCTKYGIIGGYEDGTIRPQNSATRAEVATMIRRFNNYISGAPVDLAKVKSGNEYKILAGESLKKMLDNSGLRSTVDGENVKFVPFLPKATAMVRIVDMLSKEISLMSMPYIAIKFEGELNSDTLLVEIDNMNLSGGGWYDSTGVSASADIDSGLVVIDLYDYVMRSDVHNYKDTLAISIYPWGKEETELSPTEHFTITDIAFCNTRVEAEAFGA